MLVFMQFLLLFLTPVLSGSSSTGQASAISAYTICKAPRELFDIQVIQEIKFDYP